jgi:hypothetical protein
MLACYSWFISQKEEGGIMNNKLTRTLATTLLLAGAIGISLAAQPGGTRDQGEKPQRPDFAAAAETLGTTEEALIAALGLPEAPPSEGSREQEKGERPDLAAVAATLGITEDALKSALGEPGQGRPDLAAVASALGITEEALVDAMGMPERGEGEGPQQDGNQPPQIDFAAAAETLGVTEDALIAALGIPEGGPQDNGPPGGGGR